MPSPDSPEPHAEARSSVLLETFREQLARFVSGLEQFWDGLTLEYHDHIRRAYRRLGMICLGIQLVLNTFSWLAPQCNVLHHLFYPTILFLRYLHPQPWDDLFMNTVRQLGCAERSDIVAKPVPRTIPQLQGYLVRTAKAYVAIGVLHLMNTMADHVPPFSVLSLLALYAYLQSKSFQQPGKVLVVATALLGPHIAARIFEAVVVQQLFVQELLQPYLARVQFKAWEERAWYQANSVELLGYGFGAWFLCSVPVVGVAALPLMFATTAVLLSRSCGVMENSGRGLLLAAYRRHQQQEEQQQQQQQGGGGGGGGGGRALRPSVMVDTFRNVAEGRHPSVLGDWDAVEVQTWAAGAPGKAHFISTPKEHETLNPGVVHWTVQGVPMPVSRRQVDRDRQSALSAPPPTFIPNFDLAVGATTTTTTTTTANAMPWARSGRGGGRFGPPGPVPPPFVGMPRAPGPLFDMPPMPPLMLPPMFPGMPPPPLPPTTTTTAAAATNAGPSPPSSMAPTGGVLSPPSSSAASLATSKSTAESTETSQPSTSSSASSSSSTATTTTTTTTMTSTPRAEPSAPPLASTIPSSGSNKTSTSEEEDKEKEQRNRSTVPPRTNAAASPLSPPTSTSQAASWMDPKEAIVTPRAVDDLTRYNFSDRKTLDTAPSAPPPPPPLPTAATATSSSRHHGHHQPPSQESLPSTSSNHFTHNAPYHPAQFYNPASAPPFPPHWMYMAGFDRGNTNGDGEATTSSSSTTTTTTTNRMAYEDAEAWHRQAEMYGRDATQQPEQAYDPYQAMQAWMGWQERMQVEYQRQWGRQRRKLAKKQQRRAAAKRKNDARKQQRLAELEMQLAQQQLKQAQLVEKLQRQQQDRGAQEEMRQVVGELDALRKELKRKEAEEEGDEEEEDDDDDDDDDEEEEQQDQHPQESGEEYTEDEDDGHHGPASRFWGRDGYTGHHGWGSGRGGRGRGWSHGGGPGSWGRRGGSARGSGGRGGFAHPWDGSFQGMVPGSADFYRPEALAVGSSTTGAGAGSWPTGAGAGAGPWSSSRPQEEEAVEEEEAPPPLPPKDTPGTTTPLASARPKSQPVREGSSGGKGKEVSPKSKKQGSWSSSSLWRDHVTLPASSNSNPFENGLTDTLAQNMSRLEERINQRMENVADHWIKQVKKTALQASETALSSAMSAINDSMGSAAGSSSSSPSTPSSSSTGPSSAKGRTKRR